MTTLLEPLPSPTELLQLLPTSPIQQAFVGQSRQIIVDILEGRSPKMLLVVGPCSIHDTTAAKEFAKKLQRLSERVKSRFHLVMRAYFEKPRTGLGWKGLLYDPHLDGSNHLLHGLKESRQLLLDLATIGVPAATEFLDPTAPQYYGDLIAWGSVGSRTSESQPHRQMVSALCLPTGFKNGTDGNLNIAIDALAVAAVPHAFIGMSPEGRISLVRSLGNPHCHLVLRGGSRQPNYDRLSIKKTLDLLQARNLCNKVLIDCSHDNSGKDPQRQKVVFGSIIDQVIEGNSNIAGVLLESNLRGGSQTLNSHQKICTEMSITDPCLDWETTEEMILWAYDCLEAPTDALVGSHQ